MWLFAAAASFYNCCIICEQELQRDHTASAPPCISYQCTEVRQMKNRVLVLFLFLLVSRTYMCWQMVGSVAIVVNWWRWEDQWRRNHQNDKKPQEMSLYVWNGMDGWMGVAAMAAVLACLPGAIWHKKCSDHCPDREEEESLAAVNQLQLSPSLLLVNEGRPTLFSTIW